MPITSMDFDPAEPQYGVSAENDAERVFTFPDLNVDDAVRLYYGFLATDGSQRCLGRKIDGSPSPLEFIPDAPYKSALTFTYNNLGRFSKRSTNFILKQMFPDMEINQQPFPDFNTMTEAELIAYRNSQLDRFAVYAMDQGIVVSEMLPHDYNQAHKDNMLEMMINDF